MLRLIFSATVVVTLTLGPTSPALAQPPAPGPSTASPTAEPLVSGWSRVGDVLTWTSLERLPMGDAFVEFYAGSRVLGRAARSPDGHRFRLDLNGMNSFHGSTELKDLQVRAAGRRLDKAEDQGGRRHPPPSARRVPKPSPSVVDPGTAGPYQTVEGEYALDDVTLPGLPAAVEMKAVVVAPKSAPGRRPLVLLLHGKHAPCFGTPTQGGHADQWPCVQGTVATPSYRGYLKTQRLLASQGYITVSVSANGINGQDDLFLRDGGAQLRSSLVRLHLGQWARWGGSERSSAPAVVRDAPPADLSRTLLIGHSRGGEGVSRAAMDSLVPPPAAADGYHGEVRWTIRGMLLIAPTAPGQNPTPNVPSVTILPGCDGDVYDLQGQMYVDAGRGLERGNALHGAIYVEGANHNFFNTEWTPGLAQAPAGDDSADTANTLCGPTSPSRLTPDQQQTVAATYAGTVARLFVTGDDRVRPIIDGTGEVPASVRQVVVHTHAVGGTRKPVLLPTAATQVTGDGGRLCSPILDEETCIEDPDIYIRAPHFAHFMGAWGRPQEGYDVDAKWSTPGKTVTVSASEGARVTRGDQLALRVIVPANTTGTSFTVAVRTSSGKRTVARSVTLDGLPGNNYSVSYWGQEVRVPLTGASGAINAVELTPTSTAGQLWLLDAWTWRPGTPVPVEVEAPLRVDLDRVQVAEGGLGTRDVDFPITITGKGDGAVRLFFVAPGLGNEVTVRDVGIRAGRLSTRVSLPVTGDDRYGNNSFYEVDVKAVSGSMVGSYWGGLDVVDDDPLPAVTFEPVSTQVTEGETLTWRVRLSETANGIVYLRFSVRAPSEGAELSTTDVDQAWAAKYLLGDREPARPLSTAAATLYVGIPGGQLTTDITIPTVADDVSEPVRSVKLEAFVYQLEGKYVPSATLTGSVSDA